MLAVNFLSIDITLRVWTRFCWPVVSLGSHVFIKSQSSNSWGKPQNSLWTFYRLFPQAHQYNLCTKRQFDALLKHSLCVIPKLKLPTRNSSLASKPAARSSYPPISSSFLMTCGRKHQKLPMETNEGESLSEKTLNYSCIFLKPRLQLSAKLLVSCRHL